MPTQICEGCGKAFRFNPFELTGAKSQAAALKSAQECCGLHEKPCLACVAKNFCQNKKPEDPTIKGNAARIKYANDAWRKRGCR